MILLSRRNFIGSVLAAAGSIAAGVPDASAFTAASLTLGRAGHVSFHLRCRHYLGIALDELPPFELRFFYYPDASFMPSADWLNAGTSVAITFSKGRDIGPLGSWTKVVSVAARNSEPIANSQRLRHCYTLCLRH